MSSSGINEEKDSTGATAEILKAIRNKTSVNKEELKQIMALSSTD
jgi:hypothetical protein